MTIDEFCIRLTRKLYNKKHQYNFWDERYVEIKGQAANDYVRNRILAASDGLMVCKFGTIELNATCCCLRKTKGFNKTDYIDYIKGKGCIYPHESLKALCINAGFFPESEELQDRFANLMLNDMKYIDILASYVDQESYIIDRIKHSTKVDHYGYCAPFSWKDPWTKSLKGKRVLVVHPFVESIEKQYAHRELLFKDPDVLPEFSDLILIKAVQSIAGNGPSTGFENWFDALHSMEDEIAKQEFDVALIGCGAYGLPLAAFCKRQGKIGLHMGSWVQMLFGIYGRRWAVDQPEYAGFINEHWVRPMESEKPTGVEQVENGAYW